ncbi:fimbrial protein [Cronobacter dublinensis]|uniref:fimbrial protein n=1 Tax=Cronobacter dublinensis TaxID=413497 RepID=UPI00137588EF|nr:fimbrial protein [Cronobacter dublinensis]EKY3090101.1 fimbrial protein [Cronobacter dublinensis]ELQ6229556.1 fimbrial protein [Cronobacter dublinensis]ELY4008051.1 fimbrial protein [Cronobacter dublinensis]ELY4409252.1 fimbrial protein [Cronobacter dublinensis]ELY5820417.1 fimbrial protein [Cronobacter dublinensis]
MCKIRLSGTLILWGYVAMVSGAVNYPVTADGFCVTDGGPKIFNIDTSTSMTNPDDNQAGKTFSSAFGSSETYNAHCNCSQNDANQKPGIYYKADYLVPAIQDGGNSYVRLNEYLDVAAFIHIANVGDPAVPFKDIWNTKNTGCELTEFSTGRQGSLTFRINKPFMGQVVIPSTPIVALFGTVRPGLYSLEPLAKVYVQGTITVPQSCEINSGEIITVNFGTLLASNFATRGHKPDGFVDKKTAIAYICKNISDSVTLTMTFSGAAADGMPDALATSNPDVGVLMKNDSGQVIPVNTGELPMPLNPATDISRRTGAVSILTAPVNLSGKTPQSGEFSGSAAITVNIR